jgi:SMI1-KNR4 cell-wall
MIAFRDKTTYPAPSDVRLAELEGVYRLKFPESYVAMLRIGNGGQPVRSCFEQGQRERLIERMLPIFDDFNAEGATGAYDVEVVASQIDDRLTDDPGLVGLKVLPIAVLFGGDFVCLDFRADSDAPSVAVWDHEESRPFVPHLETIAPSFEAFASMLHHPRTL